MLRQRPGTGGADRALEGGLAAEAGRAFGTGGIAALLCAAVSSRCFLAASPRSSSGDLLGVRKAALGADDTWG